MFELFKKKEARKTDFSVLHTDIHSHLIPGIDDGAKTTQDSLLLIKGLKELGFKKIITTPHVFSDYYPNSSQSILEGYKKLKKKLVDSGEMMEIEVAAEYYMDDYFEGLLAADDLLTLPEDHLLVEMSFFSAPPKLHEYIFKLRTKGYKPILAHPERYLFYSDDFEKYFRLKDFGCKFQVNLLSLMGYYGKPVLKNARKLLKHRLVDFLATDLHHSQQLELLKKARGARLVASILSEHRFFNAEF